MRRLLVLLLGLLLGLVLASAGLVGLASGATVKTVTIHVGGTNTPGDVKVLAGEKVAFVNDGLGAHTLDSSTTNWTFSAPIAAGATFTYAKVLTVNGTYGFVGDGIDAPNPSLTGNVVVTGGTAAPSPTASASPSPSRSVSPAPTRSAAAPTGTPTPSASPSGGVGGSGTALQPLVDPLTGQVTLPGASPGPSGESPLVAGAVPVPSAAVPTPEQTPAAPAYAASLTQTSPHKYGLPALLALVAIVGAASLIVRVVLSEPLDR